MTAVNEKEKNLRTGVNNSDLYEDQAFDAEQIGDPVVYTTASTETGGAAPAAQEVAEGTAVTTPEDTTAEMEAASRAAQEATKILRKVRGETPTQVPATTNQTEKPAEDVDSVSISRWDVLSFEDYLTAPTPAQTADLRDRVAYIKCGRRWDLKTSVHTKKLHRALGEALAPIKEEHCNQGNGDWTTGYVTKTFGFCYKTADRYIRWFQKATPERIENPLTTYNEEAIALGVYADRFDPPAPDGGDGGGQQTMFDKVVAELNSIGHLVDQFKRKKDAIAKNLTEQIEAMRTEETVRFADHVEVIVDMLDIAEAKLGNTVPEIGEFINAVCNLARQFRETYMGRAQ